MRKYTSIWLKIKKHKECAIAAPPSLHRRIIKGVIAEKYGDRGFRFMLDEENKSAKLEFTREGSKVTFKLVLYGINLGDL